MLELVTKMLAHLTDEEKQTVLALVDVNPDALLEALD